MNMHFNLASCMIMLTMAKCGHVRSYSVKKSIPTSFCSLSAKKNKSMLAVTTGIFGLSNTHVEHFFQEQEYLKNDTSSHRRYFKM